MSYTVQDAFNTAGLQYDNGKAIVLNEYAKRSENNAPIVGMQAEASTEWYVAGGWRFGKLTPLLTYGMFDTHQSLIFPQPANYGTFSASLRYDIVRNLALKAQFSRPQAANPVYWVISNPASTERVNVYSVGADFVF